ncbi:MAG: gliding motility-associated C-terminal domain-containing protein [Saprospiraceae bacterium]|nr:gliding motility-associated C-terminal domain-containing protein [Saprospiraceae bacterium]
MNKLLFTLLLPSLFVSVLWIGELAAQCAGLDADAGPDQFTCDPLDMITLQGNVNGNYTKIMWTPTTGLSNPVVLDPMVTHKSPGRYTYRLTAEGQSNVNLISNGDFESGNSGFSTEYAFGAPGSPFGPNNYGIGSNPMAYNSGFSPCGDNTSGGGLMMIVDGSTAAGRRVWCQTVPVVAGRDYLFEFYVMSVFPVAPAQLSISVNGNIIASGGAGAVCDWIRIEGCFQATSGSAQICISETSGIGYGNDFALDDLALFEKCIDFDEVTVEIVDIQAMITAPNVPRCGSDPFDLFANGSSFGPGFTYEWSTDRGRILSTNGMMARVRGSGTYTLTVKYKNGNTECEAEAQFDFEAPDALAGNILTSGKVSCAGDTLSLRAIMATGSGSYSYNWSPGVNVISGQGTDLIRVLLPGKYTVTIVDELVDCELVLDFDLQADTFAPNIALSGDSLLTCRLKQATINVLPSDTNQFQIVWTDPMNSQISPQNSITSNIPGLYKVRLIDKLNHCSDSAEWNIFIDTLKPNFDLGEDQFIDCRDSLVLIEPSFTQLPGSAHIFWTIAGSALSTEFNLNNKFVSKPGLVNLRILDTLNGCEAKDSLWINDLRKIPDLEAGAGDTITCLNSQITLNAITNPSDTLLYQWFTNGGNILSGENTPDVLINQKGWYFLSVHNPSNGCSNFDSVFIDEDLVKPISDAGPDQLFRCLDSLITIQALGSSTGIEFEYQWFTMDGDIVSGYTSLSMQLRRPGRYTLIVTNRLNGCLDSSFVDVLPDQNLPIVQISVPDTINCIKSSVVLNANVSSQTGNPLNYLWTSSQGGIVSSPDVLLARVDKPGVYTLTATDPSNGCMSSSSVVVQIDTLKPTIHAGWDLKWNCATQNLMLSGTAFTPASNLNFSWSTADGLIIGNSDTQNILVGKAGAYIFKVTNQINGCEETDQVDVILDTMKPLVILSFPDTLSCKRPFVTIHARGSDVGPTLYRFWTNQDGIRINPFYSNQLDVTIPGTYTLTIRDSSNFCESKATVEVVENKQIPNFSLTPVRELTCLVQQITLGVQVQHSLVYYETYWFTFNGTIDSGRFTDQCIVSAPGEYFVRVRDTLNGCERMDTIIVTENTNLPTGIDLSINQPKCSGDISGVQILNVVGGEKPLELFVGNQRINGQQINGLSPGLHVLTVRDANGCTHQQLIQIDTPSMVSLDIVPEIKLNFGENYVLQPTYGSYPDSIAWISWTPSDYLSCNDCREPELINPQEDIEYLVTYADKNGCQASSRVKVKIIKRGIWVPNSFSPNGDGVNDNFIPVLAPDSYQIIRSLNIYDRWGNLVYAGRNLLPNNPNDGWDGNYKTQPVNPGVYVWMLEIEWKNGELEKFQGDLSLIR